MEPISPVLTPEFSPHEIVFAKDQPQYKPLPALVSKTGVVLTRWHLTDSERDAVLSGADILLSISTFGNPLQPVRIQLVECEQDLFRIAAEMGLLD